MRTNRSLLGFGSTLLFTAVTTLTALVSTRLLLGWLGETRWGAFRMLQDWAGYMVLVDLTVGGALGPLLARALARGDDRALRGTLAAGIRAYLALTAVVVAIALAVTPLMARQVGPALAGDFGRAWVVLVLGVLPMALSPFRALAEAAQRGYWINLLLVGQCLLITGGSLLLARAGWGITGLALANVIGSTAFVLVLGWAGGRRVPGLLGRDLFRRGDPEVGRALRGLGLPTLLLLVSGRIGLLSDNLIVGNFLSPAAVASLVATQRLAVMAQGQLQSIGTVSWAALAELHARGDRETFNRRLVELTGLVTVLAVAALVPIAAYGRAFFDLWVGDEGLTGYAGDLVLGVAAINALLVALQSLWTWCLAGTGQVRRMVGPALVGTAANLAISLATTGPLGPIGPLLGTLISSLGVALWWEPLLLRRCFGTSPSALFVAVARPMAWGLPFAAGTWWFARGHRPWGWVGLAFEMGAAAAGFLALSYFAILSPTDRDLWRRRLAGFRGLLGGVIASALRREAAGSPTA